MKSLQDAGRTVDEGIVVRSGSCWDWGFSAPTFVNAVRIGGLAVTGIHTTRPFAEAAVWLSLFALEALGESLVRSFRTESGLYV